MEKEKKRSRTVLALLFVLDALWIFFIISRSLKPADASLAESDRILALVRRILPFMTSFLIRKLGHFTEFFLLGVLLFLTARQWERAFPGAADGRRRALRFLLPALAGLLVAAADEGVQLGVEGRSGELRDVLIDFSGVLLALLIGTAVRYLKEKKKERAG